MMDVFCSLPVLKLFFSACTVAGSLVVGYVEGEYVLIAPIDTAVIEHINVRRGDRFMGGAVFG